MQILSRLYHLYPSRAAKSIPIVKSTAIRSKSPQIYELLGELQAESDPAGDLCLLLKHENVRALLHSACSMGTACQSVGPLPPSPLSRQQPLSALCIMLLLHACSVAVTGW